MKILELNSHGKQVPNCLTSLESENIQEDSNLTMTEANPSAETPGEQQDSVVQVQDSSNDEGVTTLRIWKVYTAGILDIFRLRANKAGHTASGEWEVTWKKCIIPYHLQYQFTFQDLDQTRVWLVCTDDVDSENPVSAQTARVKGMTYSLKTRRNLL